MLKSKRSELSWGWFLVLLFVAVDGAVAQQIEGRSASESAVRQASQKYLAALAEGDAKVIAGCWTVDGTYTDEHNQTCKACDLIAKSFGAQKTVAPPMKMHDVTIRFVTADVALEEGVCDVASTGATAPISGRFSALWVRQNGNWKLDHLQESRTVPAPGKPETAAEHVAVLEPFVGQWSGNSGNLAMQISAKWNSAKTFLHREVSISSDGKPVFTSVQEIGWDPHAQALKSWTFNGDGSYGEAVWSLEGCDWMMMTTGVMPDDTATSNTQICKFIDKNTLDWKLIDRMLGTQQLPNLEFNLKRKAENNSSPG
jgi:uncharacterized protein (TIGR02246 family)